LTYGKVYLSSTLSTLHSKPWRDLPRRKNAGGRIRTCEATKALGVLIANF